MAYGMTSNVLWNFQNSFGTSQTTSLQAIPIISESLTENIEQLIETGMYNRLSESPTHEGPHIVEGEIAVEALPTIMGWFLKSSVGLTSTTSGTGIQTHIFKPRTADFDDRAAGNPTTIEIHRDIAGAFVYQSMLGNQLSFNIANGELLKMDLSLMGTQVTSKAAASPTYPTDPPFQWDQCSAYFNGWAVSNLRNLTVTFGNQLEAVHTHNSANFPYRIKRTGHQQVSISGSMVFETHSLGDAFKNQNELQIGRASC